MNLEAGNVINNEQQSRMAEKKKLEITWCVHNDFLNWEEEVQAGNVAGKIESSVFTLSEFQRLENGSSGWYFDLYIPHHISRSWSETRVMTWNVDNQGIIHSNSDRDLKVKYYIKKTDDSLYLMSDGKIPIETLRTQSEEMLPGGRLIIVAIFFFQEDLDEMLFGDDRAAKQINLILKTSKAIDFNANVDPLEFSDFTINVVSENKTKSAFKCHRLILANSSEVLRAMVTGNFREAEEKAMAIYDLDPTTVGNMLNFIYQNKLDVEVTEDLFNAAEKYNIVPLKRHCEEIFLQQLDTGNVLDTWFMLKKYQSSVESRERVIKFISENWPIILESDLGNDMFVRYPDLGPKLVTYMFRKTQ